MKISELLRLYPSLIPSDASKSTQQRFKSERATSASWQALRSPRRWLNFLANRCLSTGLASR
eukprot:15341400-Alexandrium_andersonii.AAC.1